MQFIFEFLLFIIEDKTALVKTYCKPQVNKRRESTTNNNFLEHIKTTMTARNTVINR